MPSLKLTWRAPNYGLENVSSFEYGRFWYLLLNFWGVGDYAIQLCGDYFINHDKDPVIKQPGFNGKYPP